MTNIKQKQNASGVKEREQILLKFLKSYLLLTFGSKARLTMKKHKDFCKYFK